MPNTMMLIGSATVGSGGSSSITFSSIPQTFTDLQIIVSLRNALNNYGGYQVRINGATTNNSYRYLRATGTGASTGSRSDVIDVGALPIAGDTSGAYSNDNIYILNYTDSNNKAFSVESLRENFSNSNFQVRMSGALQASTAAVTSVVITLDTDTFAENSTAYLYGIKNS